MPTPDLVPEQVLEGQRQTWTVGGRIGVGGTSIISAVTAKNGLDGVIKVPSDHRFAIDEAFLKRYRREIDGLQRVTHANVLDVLDVVDIAGVFCAIFERAASSLHQEVSEGAPIGTDRALIILRESASGLAAIHAAGLVHRDVSPKNLLLMRDSRVCVSDLGTVREVEDETITGPGEHLGSLLYISPQQAENPHTAVPADDIFSLGQIGYLLLTGQRPHGNPPPLTLARPDLPQEVTRTVEAMRRASRTGRPSAQAVARSLDLGFDSWMQVAEGLVWRRDFEGALQTAHTARLKLGSGDNVENVDDDRDFQAFCMLFDRIVELSEPTLTVRLARWGAQRIPCQATIEMLADSKSDWNAEFWDGKAPALALELPPDQQSLAEWISSHRKKFGAFVEATHRTSAWRKLPTAPSRSFEPLALNHLGSARVRKALIVVESMLALQWLARFPETARDLVSLLPSRWAEPFDALDEALVVAAAEMSKDERLFKNTLHLWGDGSDLWDRWESWIDGSCSCDIVGTRQDVLYEMPITEPRPDCPFVRLLTEAEQVADAQTWAQEWRRHPELEEIQYVADAANLSLQLVFNGRIDVH